MQALERLYKRRLPAQRLITTEFATQLTFIAEELRRVVAVLVDRKGRVEHVMVGDSHRVYLPDLGRQRASDLRFRGVRLIRTSLQVQERHVELAREDYSDLNQLQLDAVVVLGVGPGGYPGPVSWAHLIPSSPQGEPYASFQAPHPAELELDFSDFIKALEEEFQRKSSRQVTTEGTPAMLVYASTPQDRGVERELYEMSELCRTAGVRLVDTMVQRRTELHARYAIGKGKLEELSQRALELGVDLLIFGQDLSPSQLRAITEETELKVIDRSQLILDIFAQHARSKDGRIQVELAQLRYNLPRLSDRHTGMSRLMGGIGGRGPGETKLEINRRRARDRIRQLEGEIEQLGKQRELRRKQRQRNEIPVVAIVGYTNAGKSTLLNQLTSSDVLSEDKLFATLRPTSRKLTLPEGRAIILTDTVGFIHDLPQELVAAFKATLEELGEADLLLHVVDVSDDAYDEHIEAVERILYEIGVRDTERLIVLNKIDQIEQREPGRIASLERLHGAVAVNALDKKSVGPLLSRLDGLMARHQLLKDRAKALEIEALKRSY